VPSDTSLDTLTRRAGAIVNGRLGVAAHYGSPAGELAVCVRAVGLVDRSDLVKLAVTGRRSDVEDLVERATGMRLGPGGWTFGAGAHWCAVSDRIVLALAEAEAAALTATLAALDRSEVVVADRSADWAAIALVGEAALPLLGALGAVGDPRLARPFGPAIIGGAPVDLMLQSDRRALVLVERDAAAAVWQAIEAAGQPFGLSYAGAEAQRRFAILERTVERNALPPAG
jgi:glycine cleavage system aminomethyltransferase T